MKTRMELQTNLKEICKNVYFRPPSDGMKYPCIKYDHGGVLINHADNIKYLRWKQWDVIIIDENPDSDIPELFEEKFQYCSSGKPYQADGLNHFPYTLYF